MIYLNNRRAAHAWISQTTITAGQLHIATRDGEAMFFHDSIDFSPYAGTDAGSTPYRFVFVDSAGKQAVAYGGAVGGGETLGAELVTNGDFVTGDFTGWIDVETYWSVVGNAAVHASSSAFNLLLSDCFNGLDLSSLVKLTMDVSGYAGSGGLRVQARFSNQAASTDNIASSYTSKYPAAIAADGSYTFYYTKRNANSYYLGFARDNSDYAAAFTVDNISFKKMTDIPATGLHLMSAKNGTTRNMTLIETGFNVNKIAKVRIYA